MLYQDVANSIQINQNGCMYLQVSGIFVHCNAGAPWDRLTTWSCSPSGGSVRAGPQQGQHEVGKVVHLANGPWEVLAVRLSGRRCGTRWDAFLEHLRFPIKHHKTQEGVQCLWKLEKGQAMFSLMSTFVSGGTPKIPMGSQIETGKQEQEIEVVQRSLNCSDPRASIRVQLHLNSWVARQPAPRDM